MHGFILCSCNKKFEAVFFLSQSKIKCHILMFQPSLVNRISTLVLSSNFACESDTDGSTCITIYRPSHMVQAV